MGRRHRDLRLPDPDRNLVRATSRGRTDVQARHGGDCPDDRPRRG